MGFPKRHTLLLVDDEKAITRALYRLFRKAGYDVLTASSGDEGLDVLQRTADPISLIISDQRMPGMEGTQFLEKARSICPRAVRYLLTGHSDMQEVVDAVKCGKIHRYLTKPWDDENLLQHVEEALQALESAQQMKPTAG